MRSRFFFNSFLFIVSGIFIGVFFEYALFVALFIALVSIVLLFINRPLALCTLFMALITLISANLYNGERPYFKNVTVEGTVESVDITEECAVVVLKNCNHKILGKNKISCFLSLEGFEEIKEGNKLSLTGNASPIREKKTNPNEINIHYFMFLINKIC